VYLRITLRLCIVQPWQYHFNGSNSFCPLIIPVCLCIYVLIMDVVPQAACTPHVIRDFISFWPSPFAPSKAALILVILPAKSLSQLHLRVTGTLKHSSDLSPSALFSHHFFYDYYSIIWSCFRYLFRTFPVLLLSSADGWRPLSSLPRPRLFPESHAAVYTKHSTT
jgi:hypothetical protein